MSRFTQAEVEAAHDRYLETRERVLHGEAPWEALADLFTEDATFIDPAWGRIVGKAAIRDFLVSSMAGLEGWSFPHDWRMVDGARVVAAWQLQLPGARADGRRFEARGISILTYAGHGKFCFEEDVLNMVHVMQLLQESGWEPTAPLNAPPVNPSR